MDFKAGKDKISGCVDKFLDDIDPLTKVKGHPRISPFVKQNFETVALAVACALHLCRAIFCFKSIILTSTNLDFHETAIIAGVRATFTVLHLVALCYFTQRLLNFTPNPEALTKITKYYHQFNIAYRIAIVALVCALGLIYVVTFNIRELPYRLFHGAVETLCLVENVLLYDIVRHYEKTEKTSADQPQQSNKDE